MQYKELFTSDNGIMAKIFKPNFPDEYTNLFGDITPLQLDLYAVINHGDKELLSKIDESNHIEYVSSIIKIMLETWTTTKNLLSLEYDLLKPMQSTHLKTGSIEVSNTDNKTVLEAKKPFNEEEFKDNERTNSNGDGTKTEQYNVQNITSGSNGNYSVTDAIQKEITLRKLNFALEVVKNIVNSVTIQIYK